MKLKYALLSAALTALPLKAVAEEWRTPHVVLNSEYRDSIETRLPDKYLEGVPDIYQTILNKHGFKAVFVRSFEKHPEFAEIRGKTAKDITKDSRWYAALEGEGNKTLDDCILGIFVDGKTAFVSNLARSTTLHEAGHAIDIILMDEMKESQASKLVGYLISQISQSTGYLLSQTEEFRRVYTGTGEKLWIDNLIPHYRKQLKPKDRAFEEYFADAFALFYDDAQETFLMDHYPSTHRYFLKLEERFGIKRETPIVSNTFIEDKKKQLAYVTSETSPRMKGGYQWKKLKSINLQITLIDDRFVKERIPSLHEGDDEDAMASTGRAFNTSTIYDFKAYDEFLASVRRDIKRRIQEAREERLQQQKQEEDERAKWIKSMNEAKN